MIFSRFCYHVERQDAGTVPLSAPNRPPVWPGWLDDKFAEHSNQVSKQIAKQLLLLGDSVEKISEATGLSVEIIMDLI